MDLRGRNLHMGDLMEKGVEISVTGGEEFFEDGHLVRIEVEGDDVAVVEVFLKPGFKATPAPAAAEFAELVAELGKNGSFFLAHQCG